MAAGDIYLKHRSTLKQASYDSAKREYIVEDETIPVYDYDGVTGEYTSREQLQYTPCSNDALYIDDERITFIEFKNGKVEPKNVIQKAYDSLLVLFDHDMSLGWRRADFCGNISFSRENIDLILVWNNPNDDPKTAARERINNHLRTKGKFGLSDLKRYLYKDVHIMSKSEFQHEFIEQVQLRREAQECN